MMSSKASNIPISLNPAGLFAFLAVNLAFPITIEKLWNKSKFKDQYYEHLDEELSGYEGYTLSNL